MGYFMAFIIHGKSHTGKPVFQGKPDRIYLHHNRCKAIEHNYLRDFQWIQFMIGIYTLQILYHHPNETCQNLKLCLCVLRFLDAPATVDKFFHIIVFPQHFVKCLKIFIFFLLDQATVNQNSVYLNKYFNYLLIIPIQLCSFLKASFSDVSTIWAKTAS